MFNKKLLSAAVISALSFPVSANFIDDTTLELKLRTVYFGVDVEDDSSDWNDVAEGFEFNLKSGYAFDTIGFDASYYGAMPLSTSGKDPYNGYRGQVLGKDKESYHALGQAYAKMKLGDESFGAYGQLGLMRGKNGGVLGTSSRSTPSSYQGGLVEFYPAEGWVIHAGYFDGMKQRTQESVDDFVSASGEVIEDVWQVGYTADYNGFTANMYYLESADYVKHASGTIGHKIPFNDYSGLELQGMVERFSGNGDKWDSLGGEIGSYDNDATHYSITIGMYYNDFKARAIYGYTEAESSSGLGAMDDRFAYNDYGSAQTPISYLAGNFWYDEEKVLQLEAEYDFSNVGLPGFEAKIGYIIGDDINDERNLIVATPIGSTTPVVKGANLNNESELFIELKYSMPENSALNGLSFRMMNAWGETEYEHKTEDSRYLRWYMDYTVSIF